MYIIKITESFDAAHFLFGYEGKCSNIHGHRWTVEVNIKAQNLKVVGTNKGMVEDFTELKKYVKSLVEKYDHALIVEEGTLKKETVNCLMGEGFKLVFVEFRTTAENLAYYFYSLIERKGYDVKKVIVYETPDNGAIFEKEEF